MGTLIETQEAILGQIVLKTELVSVPEWGGDVWVREMTAAEADAYQQSMMDAQEKTGGGVELKPNFLNISARAAVKCMVTSKGIRIFADSDADALGKTSASALGRVVEVIKRLSLLTISSKKEAEKNSIAQGDSSSSA